MKRAILLRVDTGLLEVAERRRGERGERSINAYLARLIKEDGGAVDAAASPLGAPSASRDTLVEVGTLRDGSRWRQGWSSGRTVAMGSRVKRRSDR